MFGACVYMYIIINLCTCTYCLHQNWTSTGSAPCSESRPTPTARTVSLSARRRSRFNTVRARSAPLRRSTALPLQPPRPWATLIKSRLCRLNFPTWKLMWVVSENVALKTYRHDLFSDGCTVSDAWLLRSVEATSYFYTGDWGRISFLGDNNDVAI